MFEKVLIANRGELTFLSSPVSNTKAALSGGF